MIAWMLLVACASDAKKFARFDTDGDGFATEAGLLALGIPGIPDCDDTDADVHPNNAETCDGKDNDCDGTIDIGADDAPDWYADEDGDGTGGDITFPSCDTPDGYVADTGDCDDADPDVHPGAIDDTCDGKDDDCNDDVDDATVAIEWYLDEDGDGFGAGAATSACAAPASSVDEDGDCDDADAAVFPDAPVVCDGRDGDCDGTPDAPALSYEDADGDGFGGAAIFGCGADSGGDCDDDDDAIGPTATEACNGRDDDCDGRTDESGVPTVELHRDADGDGYGEAAATAACANADGFAISGADCDDTDPGLHPAAPERCDGLDDDCDGLTDAADPGMTGTATWYVDSDGDGHGAGVIGVLCAAPPSASLTGTDCDDTDAAVHRGALEACNGEDDDCDAQIDDGFAKDAWYADGDGDGFGKAPLPASCLAPGTGVDNALDCDDTRQSVQPGAPETKGDGVDQDCDGYDLLVSQGFDGGTSHTSFAGTDGFTVPRGGAVFADDRAAHGAQSLGFTDDLNHACLAFTRTPAGLYASANVYLPDATTDVSLLFRPSATTVEGAGGGIVDGKAFAYEDGNTGDEHREAAAGAVTSPGWRALTVTIDGAFDTTCVDGACATLGLQLHDAGDQRLFCVTVAGEGATAAYVDDLVVKVR